ncbi:hypothetical protein MLD38_039211 [Melastoma candidum]|uniref:Uncharacterized protein n=1 Tax=Melastoma candidum TaxID=119954 RepID=A0ACB9L1T0_9MYRT|nr:hypothetical protein MLD38_039211 [Melastoma candidum]
MAGIRGAAPAAAVTFSRIGRAINDVVSFVVFSFLDLLDAVLCILYGVADFFIESKWKTCYCHSSREAVAGGGNFLISVQGKPKVITLNSSRLHLDDLSDTLYARPSLVSEVSCTAVRRFGVEGPVRGGGSGGERRRKRPVITPRLAVNSTVVEMLHGRMVRKPMYPIPRWSDCDCQFCNCWTSSSSKTLHVKSAGTKDPASEAVVFLHGFISSSAFWTETVFQNFSATANSRYRFFAVDLLGFGQSPKPTDSLYTLREHVDMIEQSVLMPHKVKSFHLVAHSLGCIIALALAVKHPGKVKSLTLLAPPYFPVPEGEQATQYVMRRVAPRRVWPLIGFGASMACWYEHISRTICLLICKNHRIWEFLAKLITRNRMRTFLMEGFFCHTHNAAWHTLHNIICGTATKVDAYLDAIRDRIRCEVAVFHGKNDELIPVECSRNVKEKIPRANVKVIKNKDHITIVVGRQREFARELEEIWRNSSR